MKKIRKLRPGNPKIIRCDGGGEYKALKDAIRRSMPDIIFECTPRNTPEFNGKLERAIAIVWSRTRTILSASGMKGSMKNKLWAEAMNFVVMWWNNTRRHKKDKSPRELWGERMPNWTKELRGFGEITKSCRRIISKFILSLKTEYMSNISNS